MSVNGYRDYFKVLGVERGADADTIKRAHPRFVENLRSLGAEVEWR